tara:strand:+ start:110651 stop:110824 length:174 start_codon:yes stop_codon:yes gene_type:complete
LPRTTTTISSNGQRLHNNNDLTWKRTDRRRSSSVSYGLETGGDAGLSRCPCGRSGKH